MEEKVVVEFINDMKQTHVDLEIPLEITANDLVLALNEAYGLGMDTDNIFSCYLVADNPYLRPPVDNIRTISDAKFF